MVGWAIYFGLSMMTSTCTAQQVINDPYFFDWVNTTTMAVPRGLGTYTW